VYFVYDFTVTVIVMMTMMMMIIIIIITRGKQSNNISKHHTFQNVSLLKICAFLIMRITMSSTLLGI